MSILQKISELLNLPTFKSCDDSAKLESAYWTAGNTGVVTLSCDWRNVSKMPPLKLKSGTRIREIVRIPPRLFSISSGYYMDGNDIIFTLHPNVYLDHFLPPETEVFVAGEFNGWGNAIGNEQWKMRYRSVMQVEGWILRVPLKHVFTEGCREKACFKFVTRSREWLEPPSNSTNLKIDEHGNGNLCANIFQTGWNAFRFVCEKPIDFNTSDEIIWDSSHNPHSILIKSGLFMSMLFSPLPMGSSVSADGKTTTFRVFAPRAKSVSVDFWKNNAHKKIPMSAVENGIWEVETGGNLHGWYYNLYVNGNNSGNDSAFAPEFPILDPYAKACVSRNGPGIILDDKKIAFPQKTFRPPHLSDLVIAEVHLRDLIAKLPEFSGNTKLGFRDLAKWVRSENCYLKKLGINAVELQPIQEFDAEKREDYHWGYMTNNWFSPASHYASNPSAGTQIEEFRDLVNAFHESGLAVILDVVYNHVGEPNHLFRLDKEYYFHLDQSDNFTNWSGCGNDYNADNPMARRLICDSVLWLIERYGVDGFRFDLAELIGVPALRAIEATVRSRYPDAILIAEPWSFRGHIAYNLRKTTFSSWNDGYRDYAAKYVHNAVNLDGLRYFLAGSPEYFSTFPAQTINYTESHDDRCWLDKITECGNSNAENPTVNDRRRTHIMLAFLLSSLGTPMLAEGIDFLRTKHGKNNTYLDGAENALDYSRMKRFAGTHKWTSAWIRFRLSAEGRLFRQRNNIQREFFRFYPDQKNTAVVVIYNAAFSLGKLQYALMFNPQTETAIVQIQKTALIGFRQIANSEIFDFSGVSAEDGFSHDAGILKLPPLSVSLWIRGEY